MNTPPQSAAIVMDYILTALNRYRIFNASEKAAFWAHARKTALTERETAALKSFIEWED